MACSFGTARFGVGTLLTARIRHSPSVSASRHSQTPWYGADPDDFFSLHNGGVHFLMGDGSVRFIKSTIDFGVLHFLSTRNGQESFQRDGFLGESINPRVLKIPRLPGRCCWMCRGRQSFLNVRPTIGTSPNHQTTPNPLCPCTGRACIVESLCSWQACG
jgi:prepilin-type processing-associated H-X9-DG protein